MDTIEDLIILLKTYLPSSANAPVAVRLHCVHCAVRTLSGPGVELNMDMTPFLDSLHEILTETPIDFQYWDVVLSCIDYGLLRRKEVRPDVRNDCNISTLLSFL